MAYPVSNAYRAAMPRTRQMLTRATVRRAGVTLYGGKSLPILEGFVTVDGGNAVRRTVDLTIPPLLYRSPRVAESSFPYMETIDTPLGTSGQELTVTRGLVYPDGSIEWVPLGVFRIDNVVGDLVGDEPVTLSGVDRAAWVVDDRFLAPRTVSGPSAVNIIQNLIRESYSTAEVAVLTAADRRVGPTVIERDRWQDGVKALADSIGCIVYVDVTGRFVIADSPTLDTPPVWRLHAGRDGVVVRASTRRTRADVWNAVSVSGATPDGAEHPVTAAEVDDRPGSPTRYGDPATGAWGKRPQFMAIPSLVTAMQCRRAALARLARTTGLARVVTVESAPLYMLDADDVVDITADEDRAVSTTDRHMVDTLRVPVTATSGPFTLGTRDLGQTEGTL